MMIKEKVINGGCLLWILLFVEILIINTYNISNAHIEGAKNEKTIF